MAKITIVGIADGKRENLTLKADRVIQEAKAVCLQSGEIPLYAEIGRQADTCDEMFREAEDFEALKNSIAEKLIEAAKTQDIVFGALGDVVQNQIADAVIRQAKAAGIEIELVNGLACGGAAAAEAVKAGETIPDGVYSVSGQAFDGLMRNEEGALIYEIDSPYLASEIKLKLLRQLDGQTPVYIFSAGNNADKIPLEELDRVSGYDYSFSAYIPPVELEAKAGFTYADLESIMRRLRAPDGCPWDREMTHDSLKRYLIEEAYEVYDAIVLQEMDMLYDELGDVLLQVVFHAQIASEHRDFDSLDVTTAVCAKMINRHPHVFGQVKADTPEEVLTNWDQIKKKEKGIHNYSQDLIDVPKAMPSLMRSQKVQKRAAACGFDWDDYKLPLKKVYEELEELKADIESGKDPQEEMGDVLFAVTNLARHLKIEAETVLYNGVEKFIQRFEQMESAAEAEGMHLKEMTLDEMDILWERAKQIFKDID